MGDRQRLQPGHRPLDLWLKVRRVGDLLLAATEKPIEKPHRSPPRQSCGTTQLTCSARTSELHIVKSLDAGRVRYSAWFGRALALTRAGHPVIPQQEPEHQPVCDQEQRYQEGRNEVSGAKLTRLDPDTEQTLIECVKQ